MNRQLPLAAPPEPLEPSGVTGKRAIEDPWFPFEEISQIAQAESWRKEVHRPASHIHKWWAQRLGSVFRAIVIGALAPQSADVMELYRSPTRFPGAVVFDPFMGSGTTVGETLKLGARAVGRDINPVAYFQVRTSLKLTSRQELMAAFEAIRRDVSNEILGYYKARLEDGRMATVLYYFWVKQVDCPLCKQAVDLFPTYAFARHAYPGRYSRAQVLCRRCGSIGTVADILKAYKCDTCDEVFDPRQGPARGKHATCQTCNTTFPIGETIRNQGSPPKHRMYAKLVVTPDENKAYLPIDQYDLSLYRDAQHALCNRGDPYPVAEIRPGHNTNQVLNYGYLYWHQMFNDRQLLCLSILAERISAIEKEPLREIFTCLFTGALEFNNMFASYKGEGTGAVRHMFSHHILKPERMPLEANVWGTPKSSGAFSTLFKTRLLRAVSYWEDPSELLVDKTRDGLKSRKMFGLSRHTSLEAAISFATLGPNAPVFLSCGDSATTDMPSASIDAVITDPPFFDNVHYSELADFFYVWQRHMLGANGYFASESTRSTAEVQHSDADTFLERLTNVWLECSRVLKDDGILVFTYHHARVEGWRNLAQSLLRAGFRVVQCHPIKSEMSVATPKRQAKEPIDLDSIVVCRKNSPSDISDSRDLRDILIDVTAEASAQVQRLHQGHQILPRADVRVVVMGQLLAHLSHVRDEETLLDQFEVLANDVPSIVAQLVPTQGE
ncbi:MAG: DNA methyltransferase [Chloroflexota bacterium]